MQSLSKLHGSELAIFAGDTAPDRNTLGNLAEESASFSDLLRLPRQVNKSALAPDSGQLLPRGGNFLPGGELNGPLSGRDYRPALDPGSGRLCCGGDALPRPLVGQTETGAGAPTGEFVVVDAQSANLPVQPIVPEEPLELPESASLIATPHPLDAAQVKTAVRLTEPAPPVTLADDPTAPDDPPAGALAQAATLAAAVNASQVVVPDGTVTERPPSARSFGGAESWTTLPFAWEPRAVGTAGAKAQILPVVRNPESPPGVAGDAGAPLAVPEVQMDVRARAQLWSSGTAHAQWLTEVIEKPTGAAQFGTAAGFGHGSFGGSAMSSASATLAGQPAVLQIGVPVTDPDWGQAFNSRVLWMTGNKVQGAEIRMNPAELGPVRIKITVEEGTTSIAFNAQHAITREAIEQALPRLREMFAESGLSFGGASVSDDGVSERQAHVETRAAQHETATTDDTSAAEAVPTGTSRRNISALVDTFV